MARRWRSTRRSCKPGYSYPGLTPPSTTWAPPLPDDGGARDAAQHARRLAPDRPEIHLALGDYQQFVRNDAAAAIAAYQAGLAKAPANAELLSGAGRVEQSLGRWEASAESFTKASAVDPRSALNARRQGVALLWLHRFAEADATFDRGIAISHDIVLLHSGKAMVRLAQGDLARARDVIHRIPSDVEPTAVVTNLATYWDLFWLLDEDQQRLLLRLPPSAFDDDRGSWGIALAATYDLRNDHARARAYADSAAAAFQEQIKATPDNSQLYVLVGTALAYAGRKEAAVREGKVALEQAPITKDALGARTTSTRWHAFTSWWANPTRRWTCSSRCSRSRTTSPPRGSGSTPPSIRSARIRGSSVSSPGRREARAPQPGPGRARRPLHARPGARARRHGHRLSRARPPARRPVALKLLHPELSSTSAPTGSGARSGSPPSSQHPNILGVLDSGETPGGELWFTMPFVHGENV